MRYLLLFAFFIGCSAVHSYTGADNAGHQYTLVFNNAAEEAADFVSRGERLCPYGFQVVDIENLYFAQGNEREAFTIKTITCN